MSHSVQTQPAGPERGTFETGRAALNWSRKKPGLRRGREKASADRMRLCYIIPTDHDAMETRPARPPPAAKPKRRTGAAGIQIAACAPRRQSFLHRLAKPQQPRGWKDDSTWKLLYARNAGTDEHLACPTSPVHVQWKHSACHEIYSDVNCRYIGADCELPTGNFATCSPQNINFEFAFGSHHQA